MDTSAEFLLGIHLHTLDAVTSNIGSQYSAFISSFEELQVLAMRRIRMWASFRVV
jgi:hypothetical protein